MTDNSLLTQALVALAQEILATNEDDKLALAKQLLNDIDSSFNQLINYSTSFAALKPAIQNYYHHQKYEEIFWEQVLSQYQDFNLIGLFVLDLALTSGKENYIQSILALTEHQQLVLQPFVQEVTQRDKYFRHKNHHHPQHHQEEKNANREHLL